MRTSLCVILIGLSAVCGAAGAHGAGDISSLGYRGDTVIREDGSGECAGTQICNHDYSFENGYAWSYHGTVPPYYGCFGEAYDCGPVMVECGLYWFTRDDPYGDAPMDVYVWEGGVSGTPGEVLCMIPGITGLNIAYWPECSLHRIEIGCCVGGEFTVGCWPDFYGHTEAWFCCADENGPGGFPWTCIAPGIGWPSGWQHVNVVFDDCASMGLGATIVAGPSPAESVTWGVVKGLFAPSR